MVYAQSLTRHLTTTSMMRTIPSTTSTMSIHCTSFFLSFFFFFLHSQQASTAATVQPVPSYHYHTDQFFSAPPSLLLVSAVTVPIPTTISLFPPAVTAAAVASTQNNELLTLVVGDIAIGTAVTALVSPMVSIIDKALVQTSTGRGTLLRSALSSMITMAHDPIAYLRSPSFVWMWATYAATYCAANTIKTLADHPTRQSSQMSYPATAVKSTATTARTPSTSTSSSSSSSSRMVFVGTTLANTSACLMKDRAYAKLFGNPSSTAVPKISYAAWMIRDFAVIGSSFVWPQHVAVVVQHARPTWSQTTSNSVAQILTPMAAQLVASPLHYIGLDCYNRPSLRSSPWTRRISERLQFVQEHYCSITLARMVRVLPAFGVAGVANTSLRNRWRDSVLALS